WSGSVFLGVLAPTKTVDLIATDGSLHCRRSRARTSTRRAVPAGSECGGGLCWRQHVTDICGGRGMATHVSNMPAPCPKRQCGVVPYGTTPRRSMVAGIIRLREETGSAPRLNCRRYLVRRGNA